jgi:hypothetical protein
MPRMANLGDTDIAGCGADRCLWRRCTEGSQSPLAAIVVSSELHRAAARLGHSCARLSRASTATRCMSPRTMQARKSTQRLEADTGPCSRAGQTLTASEILSCPLPRLGPGDRLLLRALAQCARRYVVAIDGLQLFVPHKIPSSWWRTTARCVNRCWCRQCCCCTEPAAAYTSSPTGTFASSRVWVFFTPVPRSLP